MGVRLSANNKWFVDVCFGGERVRRQAPLNTEPAALAYEMFLEKEAGLWGSLTAALRANAPANRTPCPKLIEFFPRWFASYVVVNNRLTEQDNKSHTFATHLLPFFGDMRMSDIGQEEIERYKGVKRQTNLAPKSINNHLAMLHKCLVCAKEWNVLRTEVPRIPIMRAPDPTFRFLSDDEERRLLGVTQPGLMRAMIVTGLKTGMRFCELSGLKWDDINFDGRFVSVCRSAVRGQIYPPKNSRVRHVPMTEGLMTELAQLPRTSQFVFPENGEVMTYRHAWHALTRLSDAAGIEHTSWHDLRHTFASRLVSLGASLLSVQKLLGHSDIQVTMRYSHLGKDALRDAVNLLDRERGVEDAQGNVRQKVVVE